MKVEDFGGWEVCFFEVRRSFFGGKGCRFGFNNVLDISYRIKKRNFVVGS